MTDDRPTFGHVPVHQLQSFHGASLDERAEGLLSVAYHSLIAPRLAPTKPDLDVILDRVTNQRIFRETLESVCRELSKDEVQQLAGRLAVNLCNLFVRAITESNAPRIGDH